LRENRDKPQTTVFYDGAFSVIIPVFAAIGQTVIGLLLALTAIFMVLLILVQRGRGGGLAGALGGMGGSSAFGAKAGDVFTKITSVTAVFWIVLCIAASKMGGSSTSRVNVESPAGGGGQTSLTAPVDDSGNQDAATSEDNDPSTGATDGSGGASDATGDQPAAGNAQEAGGSSDDDAE
jgi:preprotein translocase subunit SecG